MYEESIHALGDQAAAKLEAQQRSVVAHLVRSMLAGMYVGACIVLIFTIGGTVAISLRARWIREATAPTTSNTEHSVTMECCDGFTRLVA